MPLFIVQWGQQNKNPRLGGTLMASGRNHKLPQWEIFELANWVTAIRKINKQACSQKSWIWELSTYHMHEHIATCCHYSPIPFLLCWFVLSKLTGIWNWQYHCYHHFWKTKMKGKFCCLVYPQNPRIKFLCFSIITRVCFISNLTFGDHSGDKLLNVPMTVFPKRFNRKEKSYPVCGKYHLGSEAHPK